MTQCFGYCTVSFTKDVIQPIVRELNNNGRRQKCIFGGCIGTIFKPPATRLFPVSVQESPEVRSSCKIVAIGVMAVGLPYCVAKRGYSMSATRGLLSPIRSADLLECRSAEPFTRFTRSILLSTQPAGKILQVPFVVQSDEVMRYRKTQLYFTASTRQTFHTEVVALSLSITLLVPHVFVPISMFSALYRTSLLSSTYIQVYFDNSKHLF